VILYGEARSKMRAALNGVTRIVEVDKLSDAIALAASVAMPGDVVLLSPACASFDQFRNFEERGKAFKEAVKNLS